jgi:hypothetical protein
MESIDGDTYDACPKVMASARAKCKTSGEKPATTCTYAAKKNELTIDRFLLSLNGFNHHSSLQFFSSWSAWFLEQRLVYKSCRKTKAEATILLPAYCMHHRISC